MRFCLSERASATLLGRLVLAGHLVVMRLLSTMNPTATYYSEHLFLDFNYVFSTVNVFIVGCLIIDLMNNVLGRWLRFFTVATTS